MQPTQTQYIEIRKNRSGEDRAFIVGTRVRVQDIVLDYERHGLTAEEIALQYPHITLAQVHSALAYYFDHKVAIWVAIHDDHALAKSLRDKFQDEQQGGKDGNANKVPS